MEASPSSALAREMAVGPCTWARQPRASLRSHSRLSTAAGSKAGLKALLRCHALSWDCQCRATAAASASHSVRASSFNSQHRSSSSPRQEGLPLSTGIAGTLSLEHATAHVNGGSALENRSEVALSSSGASERRSSSGAGEQRSHGGCTSSVDQEEEEEEQEEEQIEEPLATDGALSLPSHDTALVTASQVSAQALAGPSDDSAPVTANQSQGRPMALQAKAFGSGLLRSPTTGGVQSATSAHGLPDPAVAVRNLVAQSRQGHLSTVMSRMAGRRHGYPFGAMVAFATDVNGLPIFSLSPLEIHARNLLADPRCTLVVQIPGWSGLADARVTLFGDVYPLAPEHQEWANKIFRTRHHQKTSEKWGNSLYFRMERICDVYFVGGFGTVAWIPVEDYTSVQPDKIASEDSEETLEVLNSRVADKVRDSLSSLVKQGAPLVDSVTFIAVDSKGVDIRIHQGANTNVRRLSFDCASAVETVDEAQAALESVLQREALPASLVD